MHICRWVGCTESFHTEALCFQHAIMYHKPDKKPDRRCQWKAHLMEPVCHFLIRSNSHHPDHIISHFSTLLKPYSCPFCASTFRNRQDKKKHISKFHLEFDQIENLAPPIQSSYFRYTVPSKSEPFPVTNIGYAAPFFNYYTNLFATNGVRMPDKIQEVIETCTAYRSRISVDLSTAMHSSVVHLAHMSLPDFIELSNRLSFSNYEQFRPHMIHLIGNHFIPSNTSTLPHTRRALLYMVKNIWRSFQDRISNQDLAHLVEFKSPKNCAYLTAGLCVSILQNDDRLSLEIQRNTYLNIFHIFQIEFYRHVSNLGLAGFFFSFNVDNGSAPKLPGNDRNLFLCFRIYSIDEAPVALEEDLFSRIRIIGFAMHD